jgi:hypothetical protein
MTEAGESGNDPAWSELSTYRRAIEAHQDHPVVRQWFHQITPCQLEIPGQGSAAFLMIEFRDQDLGAMVWGDGEGNWGTGGWRPLTSDGMIAINMEYLQGAPAARNFSEVLNMLALQKLELPAHRPHQQPWWQFWR